tara:strand:+ start:651 stop:1001 length:351 start_codon:yes stop_codon:yes gene_type:complete
VLLLLFAEHVTIRWHCKILSLLPCHHPKQQACARITGHDGVASLTTMNNRMTRIDPKSIFLDLFSVAARTLFNQQGPNVVLKEINLIAIFRLNRSNRQAQYAGSDRWQQASHPEEQ